jgi:hypothetical protein
MPELNTASKKQPRQLKLGLHRSPNSQPICTRTTAAGVAWLDTEAARRGQSRFAYLRDVIEDHIHQLGGVVR